MVRWEVSEMDCRVNIKWVKWNKNIEEYFKVFGFRREEGDMVVFGDSWMGG